MPTLPDRLCFAVFIVHFILWLPMMLLGLFVFMFKLLLVSRLMGVSGTALGVLNFRWVLNEFGLRKDGAAVKLAQVLPNNSPLGIRLIFVPFYVYYRLTGTCLYPGVSAPGYERLRHTVSNRSIYFDALLLRRRSDMEQFVILGAGFDTRFYGAHEFAGKKKLFEMDKANTQQLKRKYLSEAGVSNGEVVYVEVDFASPDSDWPSALRRAGFDASSPAVFLWEGVTMYITREDVVATLKSISDVAAPGSVLLLDIYGTKYGAKKEPVHRVVYGALKEKIDFLLDFKQDARGEIKTLVEEIPGLCLGDTHVMGGKTKRGEWVSVVEVLV